MKKPPESKEPVVLPVQTEGEKVVKSPKPTPRPVEPCPDCGGVA